MKRKDDYLVFAKLLFENLEEKPRDFLKKAIKIDLLRNLFSKCVLYNYFLYSKRYLSDGYKPKSMPKQLCEAIDSLRKVCDREDKIERIKPRQLTYEEIVKHIDNEYNNLQEKYKEQLEDIVKNIELLEQKRKDLDDFLMVKTEELNDKRNDLIKEYFERI